MTRGVPLISGLRLRQIISKESSQWEIEKGLLEKTHALLTSEVARLDSELRDLKESASASDEERSSLAAKKESLKSSLKSRSIIYWLT